ncbi:hypothetical protein [Deefgea piscis]|uniref:hypothetical protein n=1 Tax=Deefgea piscis TaxID=2739061 RepID=UPI001C80F6F7|nr:hypothetical protein [Deefgea piscis]QZA81886.1 hypothetical protein K4H25_04335 [Deefgea piscis]
MRLFLVVCLLLSALPAFAARILPEGAYAQMDYYAPPVIRLDGKDYLVSAAFQVRDQQNRLIPPQRVPRDVPVWVQLEANRKDLVWKAWLLSPAEIDFLKSIGRIKEPRGGFLGIGCWFVDCNAVQ